MSLRPDRAAFYRAKAEECMRAAESASTQAARTQYMDLAAHWHSLATAADFQEQEAGKPPSRRAATD